MQDEQKATCTQFPLMLGDAMTIHKVQGSTIEHGKSITSNFERIFEPSQAFTPY